MACGGLNDLLFMVAGLAKLRLPSGPFEDGRGKFSS